MTKIVTIPKMKAITAGAKSVAAVTAGAMASRGAVNAIPVPNKTHSRWILLVGGLVAAAAYNGPQKNTVQEALIGLSGMQAFELASEAARKTIQRKPDANAAMNFAYDAIGLAGGCGCTQYGYDALNAPDLIRQISWDRPDTIDIEHTEISNQSFGV